jgi:O-methyltransferase involved in polyketide biosynthesis
VPDYIDDLLSEGHLESIEKPSSARVYDYWLGGKHNYAIDRQFAERLLEGQPDLRNAVRSNRAFVGRAVRCALESGVEQFIDIGSGLPIVGQAHEIADTEFPDAQARVIYIDYEPIAHAHAEILLDREADPKRHKAVIADFTHPEELWKKVQDTKLIHSDQPVCVLTTALLHFQPPEKQPYDAMEFYRSQLAPGSMLALTHVTDSTEQFRRSAAAYDKATDQATIRSREEIERFFGDWELVEPGLVWTVEWRPDGQEEHWWGNEVQRSGGLAGVAVKPDGD